MLSSKNEKLKQRPLSAAFMIVNHFLVEIEGEDKNDFDSPWFVAFLDYITHWYQERYGEAFSRDSLDLKSIIFIHNYPFKLSFPYSMTIDEGDSETISVVFLNKFRKEENWQEYVISPPELKKLPTEKYEEIKYSVINEVERYRYTFHNLGIIETDSSEVKALAENIKTHVENAASNIINSIGNSYNFALWELHLVIEKVLKVISSQCKGSYPKTHNLEKLLEPLDIQNKEKVQGLLKNFPNYKFVINARYGTPKLTNLNEIRVTYEVTMQILFELSKEVKKQFLVHDAIVYLKRPKYAGSKLVE